MLRIVAIGTRAVMNGLKKTARSLLYKVAEDALVEAKKQTPIDKGTARRNWKIQHGNKEVLVYNRLPYIEELERGRSKQAPRGILKPTVNKIKRRKY